MTVSEAAKKLQVSPDLIYRLCGAGKLGHTRIGLGRGVIRIDQADLEGFLASRRVEADDGEEDRPRRSHRVGAVVFPGIIDRMEAEEKERHRKKGGAGPARRPPSDGRPHD